jgi:outer membrane protein insertion porin family
VGNIVIKNATVVYHAAALPGDVTLERIDVHGSLGQGSLEFSSPGGAWARRPDPVALGPASGRVSLSPDLDLKIEALDAGTRRSELHASGSIGNLNHPEPDVKVQADLDLADVTAVDPTAQARGRLAIDAAVKGMTSDMRGSLQARSDAFQVSGVPVAGLEASVDFAGAAADTASGHATASAKVLGGRVQTNVRLDHGAITGAVDAKGLRTTAAPQELTGGPPPIDGTLGLHATANGRLDRDVRIAAALQGTGRDTSGLSHALQASASGTVQLTKRAVDLAWRAVLDSTSPQRPGVLIRQGHLVAEGSARGPLPPAIEGHVGGQVLVVGANGPLLIPLTASVSSSGRHVRGSLEAQIRDGTVQAQADAEGSRIGTLSVHGKDLDLAVAVKGADGRVAFDLDASGPLDRLSGSGQAQIKGLAYTNARLGDIKLGIQATDGRGRLRLEAPALNVTGDGELTPPAGAGASGALHATMRLAGTSLEPFEPLAPAARRPLRGSVSGTVDVEVPFAHPDRAEVDARIEGANVKSKDLSLSAAPFTAVSREGRVHIDGLRVTGSGVSLEASATVGLTPEAPIDATVRTSADLSKVPAPAGWRLAGALRGDVHVSGTAQRPRADGALDLEQMSVASPEGPALVELPRLHVGLEGDHVVIPRAEGQVAGGSFDLDGDVPFSALLPAEPGSAAAAGAARLRALWRDVQAGRLMAATSPSTNEPVDAALSGEIRLSGPLGDPKRLEASIENEATTLRVQDLAFQVSALHATLHGGSLTSEPLTISSDAGTLRAVAKMDLAHRTLDVESRGQIELRALSPFVEAASLAGNAQMDVRVTGSLDAPEPRGSVSIDGATIRVREIPEALTDVHARLVLDAQTVRLQDAGATLGGGSLTLDGTARLAKGSLEGVQAHLSAQEVSLRYPANFKSRLKGDLSLTGNLESLKLAGDVQLQRGLYDTDIFLDQALLAPEAPAPASGPPSPLLSRVALDIQAATEAPVRVKNNLADLHATGRLRVQGDLNFPAPFGRLEIQEGGTIYLQTRQFTITSGALIYNGTLDPDISVKAETDISQPGTDSIHVTVAASGPIMHPELSLTSDPSYSEKEIASLIATGRRGLDASSTGWVAGEQTAALLAGRLTRNVSHALMDLGLDEVDIQPELLAREQDPGARFTFGKQVTPALKLVYSTGLKDAEAHYFEAQYRLRFGRDITFKLQRDDAGAYTYGAGQRIRWGSPRPPRHSWLEGEYTTVREVRLRGDKPLSEPELLAALKVKTGDKVSFWDLQARADRLQQRLVEAGYIEALVSAHLEDNVASFDVRAGAHYNWRVEGLPGGPDLTTTLHKALFEEDALERGRKQLLEAAWRRGYPRAEVRTSIERSEGERVLAFHVDLGQPIKIAGVRFPGAHALSEGKLLKAAGGAERLLSDPAEARQAVVQAYHQQHYLTVRVDAPRALSSEDRSSARIVVPIEEGPQARIAVVTFAGIDEPPDLLRRVVKVTPGTPYSSRVISDGVMRMRDHLMKKGYAGARVIPQVSPNGADLDITFDVQSGDVITVGQVAIHGLRRTRPTMISREVEDVLPLGSPLDPRRLSVLERRLLDLGMFSRVVASMSDDNPAIVDVELEEQGPYTVSYDARFSSDERGQGVVDAEAGNLAGVGLTAGARYRRGRDIRDTRVSLHQPLPKAGDVTAVVFRQENDFFLIHETAGISPQMLSPPVNDTEIQHGIELQQTQHLANHWDLLYGYRFKRISSRVFGTVQDFAGIQVSLLRETRDNPLNARRGRFWSLSVEAAPHILGSDLAFFRAFGQVFIARPIHNSVTWAQGYRVGVAKGLDARELKQVQLFGTSSELFQAGGANSLRGYATDSVGPAGPVTGFSEGGQALIVVNQELRYMHPLGVGAGVFYDVGNVWAQVSDIGLPLRHSVGLGLRYDSPVGLLRLDLGIPLSRRPGDARYQWFFSLGQAF